MTITYTTGRDPGDEQATRREFDAWAVEEDGEMASIFLGRRWAERRADVAVANGAHVVRIVPCTVVVKEGGQ